MRKAPPPPVRVPHRRRDGFTACILAFLCACDTGAFCAQDVPQPSGNLEELADALLMTPPVASGPRRSYLVLANPEIETLRIYDTYDGSFLSGPNVYFPLSMRTGPSTRKLAATHADSTRFFALDSSLGSVWMARTVDEGTSAAWTWLAEIETGPLPSGLAVQKRENRFRLYVALPGEHAIQILEVDEQGEDRAEIARVDLGDAAHPHVVTLEPSGRSLLVADAASERLVLIDTTTLAPTIVTLPAAANGIAAGRLELGEELVSVALVLLRQDLGVMALRIDYDENDEATATPWGRARLPALPASAFVPDLANLDSTRPTCCSDLPDHLETSANVATIALVNGDLYYAQLDAGLTLLDAEATAPAPAVNLDDPDIFLAPPGGDAFRPDLQVILIEDENADAEIPLGATDWRFSLQYQQTLPQLAGVRAEPVDGTLRLPGFGSTLFELGLREGDLVELQAEEQLGCPDPFEGVVSALADDRFVLAELGAENERCVAESTTLLLSAFARESWVLVSSESGFLGRASMPTLDESSTVLQGEGFAFELVQRSAGPPLPGSRFEIPMRTNFAPVGLELSRTPSPALGLFGFGAGARVPTSLVGGEIQSQAFDDGGAEVPEFVHRLWMTTSVGLLLEMEQGERDSANVQNFN